MTDSHDIHESTDREQTRRGGGCGGKVLLAESYEQARLIGSAEQAEAVRAALEGRKGDYRPS